MKRQFLYILFLCFTLCSACKNSRITEIRHVLSEADSLRSIGVLYSDSSRLSDVVKQLEKSKLLYRSEYSLANYYYARMLMQRNNPTEAMRCFINALHYNSSNHNLRGRIYTNMAIICRLDGNHSLSYDMFELSSKEFFKDKDTIAYYYALNSMAFELAEMSKKDECLHLLKRIDDECSNPEVEIKLYETYAEAYFNSKQYDSAIYYVSLLEDYGYNQPTGLLIKAQSYSLLNIPDSAYEYARRVVEQTESLFDLNNSLYILAYDNNSQSVEGLQEITSYRSDIQKQIELRHAKLSLAVQLLKQDKKTNHISLFLSFCIFIFIIYLLIVIRNRKRIDRSNVCQDNTENIIVIGTETLDNNIKKEEQLRQIEQLCAALRISHNIKQELHWSDYDKTCEIINSQFNFLANKLKATGVLSKTEIRLCFLVVINFSFKQISEIMPYAYNSVGKLKDTTAKHLGTTGKQLRQHLLDMIIKKF